MVGIPFNIVYWLVFFVGVVRFPELSHILFVYAILYLLAENLIKGKQEINTPIKRGAYLFFLFFIVSFIVFSITKIFTVVNPVYQYTSTKLVILALMVSFFEEGIFRGIIAKIFNNPVLSAIMFAVLHIFTGLYVLKFESSMLVVYLIFTFIFGLGMTYLNRKFRSLEPARAVHFTFLLFSYGIAQMFGGWFL